MSHLNTPKTTVTRYIPQQTFTSRQSRHDVFGENVQDEAMSTVLAIAIGLARRYVGSERSLRLMSVAMSQDAVRAEDSTKVFLKDQDLPEPVDPFLAPETEKTHQLRFALTEAFDQVQFRVILDPYCTEQDAGVDEEDPFLIGIRAALVTAAARSYDRREIARATYQCHSIILAVALVHELQHLYRMHLVPAGAEFHTPATVTDGVPARRSVTKDLGGETEILSGEGGWWYELFFFGGEIVARQASGSQPFEGAAENLCVQRYTQGRWTHFVLTPDQVAALFTADDALYDDILPLTSRVILPGQANGRRLRLGHSADRDLDERSSEIQSVRLGCNHLYR